MHSGGDMGMASLIRMDGETKNAPSHRCIWLQHWVNSGFLPGWQNSFSAVFIYRFTLNKCPHDFAYLLAEEVDQR